MRILEVHYSTAWAGAERFVVDLCNELSANHEVCFCTIVDDTIPGKSYYKSELSSSIRYFNLGCKSGMDIMGFMRLYKLIKKIKPDIIHAHTDALNLWLPSLLYRNAKYFHTIHSLAHKRQYRPWLTPVYRYFYKHRIHAVTISNICKQSYTELYHLSNAIQIDNGRSQMMPSPELKKVEKEIKSYRNNSRTKVFVHVARCSEPKNEPLLFKTFQRLYDEKKDCILLIIGANYDSPEYINLLNNAPSNIHWLGLKSNVCDYLLNSDFFILSSKWEGLPISLLEAMSVGVIPICTPAGGIPDVIKDRSLGYLSPSMNEEDFFKTVIEAIQTAEDFNTERLIEYFRDNYSMNHCANQYTYAFQKMI